MTYKTKSIIELIIWTISLVVITISLSLLIPEDLERLTGLLYLAVAIIGAVVYAIIDTCRRNGDSV